MEMKPGYKQTEVGVIPEAWEVKSLGEIGEALIGLTYKPSDVRDYGTLVLRSSNIQNDALAFEDNVFVDTTIPERIRVQMDDVLICVRNGSRDLIGKSALLDERTKGMTFGAFMAVYRSQIGKLASYLFQSAILKRQINEHLGATINQITNKSLNSFRIPVPPSDQEQREIATALSDVDGLLGGLDRLIAKKRDLKQAAMQQLLTGQTRLPGFHGEWEVKRLGDVISHCFSGATPRRNRPEFYRGNIRWITSGELNYNVITDSLEKISSEAVAETNLTIHPVGTFLMAITGLEAEGTRGACGVVGAPSTTNQSCMAVFPTDALAGEYLFHYYVFRGKSLALQYCQGTKQQSYTASLVKQLPIDLPPTVGEQTAIAEVLTDMDAELSALEQRRKKTRGLKQAMMQELLTGRTRLVPAGGGHA
jgi:type I restriction enzyme S subunit